MPFEVRDLREITIQQKKEDELIDILYDRGITSREQLHDILEPNYFAVIPIDILEKKGMSANAKLLFAEVMALSCKSGKCYATNRYLSERLGLSERSIPQLLKELKEDTLVKIDITRNKRGTYRDIRITSIGVCGGELNNEGGDNQITTPGVAIQRGQKRNRQREIDKVVTYSQESLKLSKLLYELIKEENPAWYVKPDFDRWAAEMDKIIRLDNRTYEQIEFIIRWCQKDDFWKGNILSPAKLRKQFDQLVVRVKVDVKKKNKKRLEII